MARYYSKISKEEFLQKIKELMRSSNDDDYEERETDEDLYPYELPKVIEKDLAKVRFDYENHSTFNEEQYPDSYPTGHRELLPDFHVFFAWAGGDWEYPVGFIFYFNDNKLRAYVPKDGNVWNKKEKCAYGSEEDSEPTPSNDVEEIPSFEKMREEIIKHITLK